MLSTWTDELTERAGHLSLPVLTRSLVYLQQHFAPSEEFEHAIIQQYKQRRSHLTATEITTFLRLHLTNRREWAEVAESVLSEVRGKLAEMDLESLLNVQMGLRELHEFKNKRLPEWYEDVVGKIVGMCKAIQKGKADTHLEDLQTLNSLLEVVFHSDCDRGFWRKLVESQIDSIIFPKRSAAPARGQLVPFFYQLSRLADFAPSKGQLKVS